jgi:hypothetical protein
VIDPCAAAAQPGVRAIFVAQRVLHADRARYEAYFAAQNGLNGSFPIRDVSTAQDLVRVVPAANSSEYLAVMFGMHADERTRVIMRNMNLRTSVYVGVLFCV